MFKQLISGLSQPTEFSTWPISLLELKTLHYSHFRYHFPNSISSIPDHSDSASSASDSASSRRHFALYKLKNLLT